MLALLNKVRLLLVAAAVAVYSFGWHLREYFTADLRKVDIKRTLLLVLLILAAASALWQYAMPQVRVITQNQFHPVPVIKETTKIRRVTVPCPEGGIVTLDREAVVKKLDLNFLPGGDIAGARAAENQAQKQQPQKQQVLSTAAIPETDNGVDVVAIMDMESGVTSLVAREQSAPLFQFRHDAAVGIKYGLDQRLMTTGTVYGRWDFLRIKDVYFSANGEITTGADAKLQLGAEYRW